MLKIVRWCVLAVGLVGASPAIASGFSGQFEGIGTAGGMTLTLQESSDRVVGRFHSGRGEAFSLNGRRTGDAAQGSVERSGQSFFFHLEERPLGVQFLLIPKTPEQEPDIAGATDYSFVQKGLQLPKPSVYRPAPPRGIDVDIIQFVDAFRDWDPADMARIYVSLEGRYRELIQLFDHAAAEVVWRVCTTSPPNDVFTAQDLDQMLERQRTDCRSYLSSITAVRDAGLLNEFLRKSNFQLELIRETVKCDRGLSPETKCADVSAMSGPLMLRWRRAEDVMRALVGDDTHESPQVVLGEPVPISPTSTSPVGASSEGQVPTGEGDVGAGVARIPRMRPGTRNIGSSVPTQGYLPRARPSLN
ncbi:hypothetical protein QMT40_002053 [Parvibaculaceae bacterium PLY_AMNH_Bact1]|nr:hypothetical protein QMT40_002053 [Parvibaculaceae bacterium PLY_AMNH_Bact1]